METILCLLSKEEKKSFSWCALKCSLILSFGKVGGVKQRA